MVMKNKYSIHDTPVKYSYYLKRKYLSINIFSIKEDI